MKKVKVIEKFMYMGIEREPGTVMNLPDLRALHLIDEGTVEYTMTPINRIYK